MHVFVTGGTGQTGPAIVTELIGSGHRVTGLARSDAAAERLDALGAGVVRGSLEDLDSLRAGATSADGVVHMAMATDFDDVEGMTRREVNAIRELGEALGETGRPLLTTSGTLVLRPGQVSSESDSSDPDSIGQLRIPGEQACLALATKGVRAIVVRLAPTVHGPRDHGFIPMLIAAARRTGVSAYVGDGSNRWPAVHRLDAANLYRLALERSPGGRVVHGVGEPAVAFRAIAEKIGEKLNLPVRSVDPEQAPAHFGNPFMAAVFGTDAPASSGETQRLLGWKPNNRTLLDDLEYGDYLDVEG
ncbi:SDR family oxidoreductase [Paramicrobacterium fandaimingii]|uniref:SDR family oxidoreductase n=1 Tax=Paramicrobacterium fandaimingii TaxID=2708079 RepID=UPI001423C044|nr:SDR family oxidoreductase [Microbacterium fandaimingii]